MPSSDVMPVETIQKIAETGAQSAASLGDAVATTGRLLSLDALRGFDMFWIIGAEGLVEGLNKVSTTGIVGFLATQLDHVEWAGFRFYDMIFPLFVFLAGVSTVFSLDKIVAKEGKKAAHIRVIRRFVLLFIVGIIYSGGLSKEWPDIRLLGVLQRIALSYLGASLLYINFGKRTLVAICAAILIGYWALFTFVPVPAVPELTAQNPEWGLNVTGANEGSNWTNYIDYHYLGGRRYNDNWDPEGLLSSFPAVASALLGVFAGMLLKNKTVPEQKKVWLLIGVGAAGVVAGYLWGLQFPVVKKLWTSSFVLVAAGYSSILLGVFYQVIDIWKYQRWATPFLWIGSNALTLYLAGRFIRFRDLADLFVGGNIKAAAGDYAQLLNAVVALTLLLILARFMYKRRIFLRL